MDILKIVVGVIATVVAFYATSSMLLAQKQIVAATRLSGYLTYWQNWILETKLSKVYAVGMVWNQEERELRRRGGSVADVIKLGEQKKERIAEMKEILEKGVDFDKAGLIRVLQRYSKESLLEWSSVTKQNIIEGKTFVTDEEATALGTAFTHKCIELKMGILDLVDGGITLMLVVKDGPADFELKDYSSEIAELIWKGITVSRTIDLMSQAARAVSSKSVLALTLQNIVSGKRLTKR